ncbi:unnamed protein product [Polarella glacialis]|uniref:Uncharacterized protein n=1 Tax=Polarella glacialis TaxID=89957 RepID=A0A813GDU8_POLGL|nr:unnamed protein product [Polarella glacialis]
MPSFCDRRSSVTVRERPSPSPWTQGEGEENVSSDLSTRLKSRARPNLSPQLSPDFGNGCRPSSKDPALHVCAGGLCRFEARRACCAQRWQGGNNRPDTAAHGGQG